VFEAYLLKSQGLDAGQGHRMAWPGFLGRVQDLLEVIQRHLRFPVDVNDIAQLLQGAENKKGVNKHGNKIAHGNAVGEYQVEHHQHDGIAQQVHTGALHEAQAPQVTHLLKFQL
jgi:hypothetical protein